MDTRKWQQTERQAAASGPAKKAYQKPSFRSERVFETMALACGKVNPTQLQCKLNKKAS